MNIIKKLKSLFSKNIMYSSEICSDCQKAEKFLIKNKIDIVIKKIENPEIKQELKKKYGRVLVPTIIMNGKIYIGFSENKEQIIKDLNLSGAEDI